MRRKNLPQIKTYEIDYQFIIDNYTNPKLWSKVWNLFIFKNYVYTLTLSSIDVKKYEISFEMRLDSDLDIYNHCQTTIVKHNIKNSTIKILKNQINSAMFSLAINLENEVIANSPERQKINNSWMREKEYLAEIANDFLTANNVTNEEIRDAYVDYYVDKNETLYDKIYELNQKMRFNHLTDLFLMLASCCHDEDKKQEIIDNQRDDSSIQELLNEVDEYMEYTETSDWTDEMQYRLEAI